MPNIVDVIQHKTKYNGTQTFVVVDEPIRFIYTKHGNLLIGEHDGFFDFMGIGTYGQRDAFGGRVFDLDMSDGTKFNCHGQVWSVGAPEGHAPLYFLAAASPEQLAKCYVFRAAAVLQSKLNAWLAANTPSTDYRKYEHLRFPAAAIRAKGGR